MTPGQTLSLFTRRHTAVFTVAASFCHAGRSKQCSTFNQWDGPEEERKCGRCSVKGQIISFHLSKFPLESAHEKRINGEEERCRGCRAGEVA